MSRAGDAESAVLHDWRSLMDAWRTARLSWNDPVSRRFEKEFLGPWEENMPAFFNALEALDRELRACERVLRD